MNLPEPVRRHPVRSLWCAALFCALFFAHPRSQLMFLLGFLVVSAGMALRVWCGASFDGAPTAGPGRVVRHPGTLGALLAAAGFLLMSTSLTRWGSSLFLWACFAAALRLRVLPALAEADRSLAARMGDAFTRWSAEVPLLLPDTRAFAALRGLSASLLAPGWGREKRAVWAALGLAALLRFKLTYRL
ncbi:MAG: hypothetical protein WC969_03970 [Elusimicrobiota bacterium]|jgi:protein-S-isoprenylcysteine O-methyltransferase Ste14